jgi:transcriptional regulator with XRE-family HTH domain
MTSESVRRLSKLRKMLRLSQAQLAFLFGKKQYQISRLLGASKPEAVTQEYVDKLGAYLSRLDQAPAGKVDIYDNEAPPTAEEYSPLWFDREHLVTTVGSMKDVRLPPTEWDRLLESQIWTRSKKPFRASAILAELAGLRPGETRAPSGDAIVADIALHGMAFAESARSVWRVLDEDAEASEDLEDLGSRLGGRLLGQLGRGRKQKALPLPPRFVAGRDGYLAGMNFLSRVFELAEDSTGQVDFAELGQVHNLVKEFRLAEAAIQSRRRTRREQASSVLKDWKKKSSDGKKA